MSSLTVLIGSRAPIPTTYPSQSDAFDLVRWLEIEMFDARVIIVSELEKLPGFGGG
ncbi:MAG: hypothetical protein WAM53_20250 [Terrimicrobiaceae bacterium]